MAFLTDWLENVIAFLLLAAVMDLLMPSNRFQQYAKVVIGLLLLFVMLQPLWKILSVNIEEELSNWTERTITNQQTATAVDSKKSGLESAKQVFILEQSEQQLKSLAENELKQRFHKQIMDINLQVKEWKDSMPEHIEHIDVYVASLSAGGEESYVQEVRIDSSEKPESNRKEERNLAAFLSKKWNIPIEQLNIHMVEEGDSLE
ncbi:stage III sporulation protein AF [Bacillus badius]|uniref:stage III sporulation protein AF n=1 Tax=Bacillus badius TaxID=1455 RepID=UPI0005971678|nr:stage III sporulation protein AF [Bacillus badius]KIL75260.1 Stage III sporulation protein AF [Bacillus badius]